MFGAFFERTGGMDAKFCFGVFGGYRGCRGSGPCAGFHSRGRLRGVRDGICAGLTAPVADGGTSVNMPPLCGRSQRSVDSLNQISQFSP